MKVWSWIKRKFSRALREVWKFIKLAHPKATRIIFAELKGFAISVISDLEIEDITGAAKRKKALAMLKEEAVKRGIKAGTRIINQLIENTLAVLRREE